MKTFVSMEIFIFPQAKVILSMENRITLFLMPNPLQTKVKDRNQKWPLKKSEKTNKAVVFYRQLDCKRAL